MEETEEKEKCTSPSGKSANVSKSTDGYEKGIGELKLELESCKDELKATQAILADKEEKLDMVNAYHAGLKEDIQSLKQQLKNLRGDKTFADAAVQVDEDELELKLEIKVIEKPIVSGEDLMLELPKELEEEPADVDVDVTEEPACGPVDSIAESLKQTAESALTNSGIVFDEKSGLYYDNSNGYYYNAETSLYYDPKTGTYFYYNHDSGKYEFHSQVDVGAQEQQHPPDFNTNFQSGDAPYYPPPDAQYPNCDPHFDPDSKYNIDNDLPPYYNTEHQYGDSHYHNTFHHYHYDRNNSKRGHPGNNHRPPSREDIRPYDRYRPIHKDRKIKSEDISDRYRSRSREKSRDIRSRHSRLGTASREVSEEKRDKHRHRRAHSHDLKERKSKHHHRSRESSSERKNRDKGHRESADEGGRKHKKKKDSSKSSHSKHKKEKKKKHKDGESSSELQIDMDVDDEAEPDSVSVKKEVCSEDSNSNDIRSVVADYESTEEKVKASPKSVNENEDRPKSRSSHHDSDMESGEVEESSGTSESDSDSSFEEEKMEMDGDSLPADGHHYDDVTEENIDEISAKLPPCIRAIVMESDVLTPGSLHIITYSGGTIGRDKDKRHCLIIPDVGVSKRHAELKYDQELKEYQVRDLGSQNGTQINQTRLSVARTESDFSSLKHDDILSFAKTKLLIHIHSGTVTCDKCEPGQVLAQMKDQKNKEESEKEKEPYVIMSKDEKRKAHKKELKKIKKKFGLENSQYVDNGDAINNPKYMDMAEQRRKLVGSDVPGEAVDEAPASVTRPIAEENKGHKMLSKMGWKEGESLGKDNTGIVEPIAVSLRMNKAAGLGSKLAGVASIDTIPEATRNKKWLQAQQRYEQAKEIPAVDSEIIQENVNNEAVENSVNCVESKDKVKSDSIKDAPIFQTEEDEAEQLLQKKTFLEVQTSSVDT